MAQQSENPPVKNNQLVVGGLGRPFTLGMLYNAPKDELVPGVALWDSDTLKSHTVQRPQRSSNFAVSTSDSTSDTTFNLNVDASLKLSVMSGLVEVGGSANYLNDQKQFKNQCRVTLHYKATTHFEELSLTADMTEKIQNEMNDKSLATHLVTGIEYGANAVFVFDSEQVESGQKQSIQGNMNVVIKKIPQCDIDGEAHLDLTQDQTDLAKSLSVQFYGDFLLKSNPATFDAAVKTYVELPLLLMGDDGKPVYTVPMRVWLLPLEVLNIKSVDMTKDISVGLVIDAETTVEDLAQIQMRCNDCLSVSAVGKFPQLYHQLHMFNKLCHYYGVELQTQMATLCPAIREGKKDESVLRHVFDQRDASPFSEEKLSQWLDDKEREINVVQSFLDILEGVEVFSTQSQVDKFVLKKGKENRYGFIFTSLKSTDEQLEEMHKYIKALKRGQTYEMQSFREVEIPWFRNNDVLVNMRELAGAMFESSAENFIAAINNDKFLGFAMYTYCDGILRRSDQVI